MQRSDPDGMLRQKSAAQPADPHLTGLRAKRRAFGISKRMWEDLRSTQHCDWAEPRCLTCTESGEYCTDAEMHSEDLWARLGKLRRYYNGQRDQQKIALEVTKVGTQFLSSAIGLTLGGSYYAWWLNP